MKRLYKALKLYTSSYLINRKLNKQLDITELKKKQINMFKELTLNGKIVFYYKSEYNSLQIQYKDFCFYLISIKPYNGAEWHSMTETSKKITLKKVKKLIHKFAKLKLKQDKKDFKNTIKNNLEKLNNLTEIEMINLKGTL